MNVATLGGDERFNNRRLLEQIGKTSQAEAGVRYDALRAAHTMAVSLKRNGLWQTREWFKPCACAAEGENPLNHEGS